ncbi:MULTISPECIES: PTS transporter subunit EIIC [Aerococcus]|uniref:PTS sugar transporter subunit IIA n=1 Tax=Aerococcus sanguinicola TaxID=119206 RepID=A0A5N1GGP7_9LACT|nr:MULTISPECIES: PTS transporter subunit EIIC [Aerococcus]KAA9300135.1 PTS sugar transporter subunit IIA [Aerococcus sanguinicola]MDK6369477.1 PTS transporter subunit EIIC [Aerococcus sp. UMB9870]MDK6679964.1 PTS transporter subunit EIIC [Aerococcus sp. UMB8608]MDK6686154.1 PTS transporter subunit EIIC [Aerococcus sp. UMB8623]MDK6939934.1 PTS transporter subunit EIIC [Aerococcus sp. UMB8487]
MTTNYHKIGQSIIDQVDLENIQSITHCATRLRLEVNQREAIDDEAIEEIDQVKGVFFNSGQYQIILGTGTVNKVYDAIIADYPQLSDRESTVDDMKERQETGIKRFVRNLSDIFLPIIPAIVATGLFMGLKGVILNETILAFFGVDAGAIPVELTTLISVLTDTVFQFLPALITWSAFKKFGGTPILGFVAGLILVSPMLPNAYEIANIQSDVEPMMLFGSIPLMGYQGSVLVALVVGYLGARFEVFTRKRMPDALDLMFTPFVVLLLTTILGLIVLGPILHVIEGWLIALVEGLIHLPLGIGGLIIGFIYPLSVMVGMHHLFITIETTLLAATGFNPLITVCAMYGFANAAVAFAVSLRSKKKSVKVVATSAGLTQLLGVSEPALFGITLRYGMRPLAIMLAGSALGGAALSLLGIQANSYGLAVILSPMMYVYDSYQLFTYILVGILTFILTFIVAYLFALPKSELQNN